MAIEIADQTYPVLSVDDHVCEPPTVWTDRLAHSRWGERIPHLSARPADGGRWVIDGTPIPAQLQARWSGAADATDLSPPDSRLRTMDQQGVDVSVLYPMVAGPGGETFGRLTDPDLELACVRAYNDWLIDDWASTSSRFVPLCLVPVHPVEAAVAELERAVGRGHRGLVLPALPMFLREGVPELTAQGYAPLWEACATLDIPVSFHSGTAAEIVAGAPATASDAYASALRAINEPISSALFVAHLLLSQVLAPHPRLKAVFPENSLSWMAFALETMDYLVTVDRLTVDTYDVLPSEVFARQCFSVGSYERLDQCASDAVPLSRVLWSTCYPGPGSTWPDTASVVAASLARVPDPARRQVLWENAAELYHLRGTAVEASMLPPKGVG